MKNLLCALGLIAVTACGPTSAAPTVTPVPTPAATPTPTTPPASTPTASAAAETCPAAWQAETTSTLPDSLSTRLADVLQKRITDTGNPSVSAAVIVPGVGTWSGAAGFADVANETPATTDTVYAMGSVTKTFVGALALQLVRDGLVDLDGPASTYLDPQAAAKTNDATVRQLLAHTSGIDNYTSHEMPDHVATTDELLGQIGQPHASPGAQYEYSNSNYLLLGLLIERVGGAPLEDQLHQRLLDPLGLTHTYFAASEKITSPVAHGYGRFTDQTGDLYDGSGQLPNAITASGAWAAGSIASTPADISRWLYALCAGQVLGSDRTAEMFKFGNNEYGLGIDRQEFSAGKVALGHAGLIPGYVTLAFVFTGTGDTVVVTTNTDVEDLYLVLLDLEKIVAS